MIFALLSVVRPDAIRTRTLHPVRPDWVWCSVIASWSRPISHCLSLTTLDQALSCPNDDWSSTLPRWRHLIKHSPALMTPDQALSRADDTWSRTLPPWRLFLLTDCQGFVNLHTSGLNVFCSCFPHQDPRILIFPLLTSTHLFLMLHPTRAASWSYRDSIIYCLVISDASWPKSNAILLLYPGCTNPFSNSTLNSVSWPDVRISILAISSIYPFRHLSGNASKYYSLLLRYTCSIS